MDSESAKPVPQPKVGVSGHESQKKRRLFRPFLISLVALSLFAIVILAFHGPLLRFGASLLIHEDPLPQGKYAVLLMNFPQWSEGYETVSRILPKGGQVVLLKGKKTRLMRLGLETPWWQKDIDQLQKRGIENLEFLEDPEAHYTYQYVGLMKKWLDSHPDYSLCVCHGRFQGRALARILARHLNPKQLDRVALIPVNEPDFDPDQWWRKKEGQAAILGSCNNLVFDLLLGDGEAPGPDWDPKAYEESLP